MGSCRCVITADETLDVGWNVEAEDWLLMARRTDVAESPYWVNTICGLDKTINIDVTTAEITLTTALSASGNTITLPPDFLTDGGAYVVTVIKVSPETGLDIQKFDGTSTNRLQAHNLGAEPEAAITVNLTNGGSRPMYLKSVREDPARGDLYVVYLDSGSGHTSAAACYATATNSPTPTGMSLGTSALTNGTGAEYVMFLFASRSFRPALCETLSTPSTSSCT
jgi:hypothetical protein